MAGKRSGRVGRVELIAACRRLAIEGGTTLEAEIWRSVQGMMDAAASGDTKAFEQLMKWFGRFDPDGAEPKDGGAAVQVNVGVAGGPTPPNDLETYYAELERLEQQHGAQRITVEPATPDLKKLLE